MSATPNPPTASSPGENSSSTSSSGIITTSLDALAAAAQQEQQDLLDQAASVPNRASRTGGGFIGKQLRRRGGFIKGTFLKMVEEGSASSSALVHSVNVNGQVFLVPSAYMKEKDLIVWVDSEANFEYNFVNPNYITELAHHAESIGDTVLQVLGAFDDVEFAKLGDLYSVAYDVALEFGAHYRNILPALDALEATGPSPGLFVMVIVGEIAKLQGVGVNSLAGHTTVVGMRACLENLRGQLKRWVVARKQHVDLSTDTGGGPTPTNSDMARHRHENANAASLFLGSMPANRVTQNDVLSVQELTVAGQLKPNIPPASWPIILSVLNEGKSRVAEAVLDNVIRRVAEVFGNDVDRPTLVRWVTSKGAVTTPEAGKELRKAFSPGRTGPFGASDTQDVQDGCRVLAKLGLPQFESIDIRAGYLTVLAQRVDRNTLDEKQPLLHELVVVAHIMEQAAVFKAKTAAGEPFTPFGKLSPKALRAVDAFANEFNTLAVKVRHEDGAGISEIAELKKQIAALSGKRKHEEDGARNDWGRGAGNNSHWTPTPPHTTPPPFGGAQEHGKGGKGKGDAGKGGKGEAGKGGKGDAGKGGKGGRDKCRDFARGACTRGDFCRFPHEI